MQENLERVEVNITHAQAITLREYIETGEYASVDEIFREALRGWSLQKAHERKTLLMRPEKTEFDPSLAKTIMSPKLSKKAKTKKEDD